MGMQEFSVRSGEEEDIVLQLGDWVWEDAEAAADVYRQVLDPQAQAPCTVRASASPTLKAASPLSTD